MSTDAATEPQDQTQGTATESGGDVDTTTTPDQKTHETTDAESEGAETTETEATEAQAEETETSEEPAEIEPYQLETPANMPEDFKKDDVVFGKLAEKARELGLTKESAQGLADGIWPLMYERAVEQQRDMHQDWLQASQLDSEFGGEDYDENMQLKQRALEAFGTKELAELMDGPFGDHPEVNRILVRVGKTVSEDTFVGGETGDEDPNSDASIARAFYPNTPDSF